MVPAGINLLSGRKSLGITTLYKNPATVLARQNTSMEQIKRDHREPSKIDLHKHSHLIFDKDQRQYNGTKIDFSSDE